MTVVVLLSKGGLHQSNFSPQLSLVTAGTPTLTINSFSSPSSGQQTSVVPSTGMLVQPDYSTSTQAIASSVCPMSVSVSTIPSLSASSTSTMLVQSGQTCGNNAAGYLQQTTSTTKKLENYNCLQTTTSAGHQTVKFENKTSKVPCICRSNNAGERQ